MNSLMVTHKNIRIALLCGLISILQINSVVGQTLTDTQYKAEIEKYKQPISVISKSAGMSITSECMLDGGDYIPSVPDAKNLDAESVTSPTYFSPAKLDKDWFIFDHVGMTDSAFSGKRHIVKRDTRGIQWFGYDAAPQNDFIIRDFTEDISNNPDGFSINIKQAPVRADWHTINGSGILFGMKISNPPQLISKVSDSQTERKFSEVSYDVASHNSIFSAYAFVATNKYNEMRYYDKVNIQDFRDGKAPYYIIQQVKKNCNSQSITVKYTSRDKKLTTYIGNKIWDIPLTIGNNHQVGLVSQGSNEVINSNIILPELGKWCGAMVDYAEHCCSSLSSVYMFNYTFNEKEYF